MMNEFISEKDKTNNIIRSIIALTLRSTALLCATGALMQTFLKVIGFEAQLIYIFSTVTQASNVITIMVCSRWADKGNIIKRSAYTFIPTGVLFLFYIPFCIVKSASLNAYVLILLVGVFQSATIGLSTVCEYKIPYYIYDSNDYGRISGVTGFISSVVTLGVSAYISTLVSYYEYEKVMKYAFLFSAIAFLFAAVITLYYKSLLKFEEIPEKKEQVPLMEIFKHPVFYKLLIPNLFRGFSAGVISVIATIALDIGHSESTAASTTTIQVAATLLCCLIFVVIPKNTNYKRLILIGNIFGILLPLLIIKNSIWFLFLTGVIIFGRSIADYAIPAFLIKEVPLKISGPYHAWRMILYNVGTIMATLSASVVPIPVLLLIASILGLISGIMYFCVNLNNG